MSPSLAAPQPDRPDNEDQEERLAVVLDLPTDGQDAPAETADSRWRAAWARLAEEAAPAGAGAGRRALAAPPLRRYVPSRASLAVIRPGALIIVRCAWTLARRVMTSASALTGRTAGKAAENTEKPGKTARKWPGKNGTKSISLDAVIGGTLVVGMAVAFVVRTALPALTGFLTDNPLSVLRAAGFVTIVFLPAAWVVGTYAQQRHAAEQSTPDSASEEAPETTSEVAPETTREETPPAVLEWVKSAIGDGRAVHLRELLLDLQQHHGGEALEMADLRAGLEAHGIPIRPSVKAPASDHDGAIRVRVGVHRDDLPPDPVPAHEPPPGPEPPTSALPAL
ncbi:hypothetical protein [Streptomyces sp. SPB074]|uniref:hypothetical protein n=1 Tax=Streptomyces sp. (strain SPB074) TaxID=465543 RepID=UPI00017F13FF|nr:hypothetical protein [Streptomyces sp. SPB074]EDY44018.1 vegetative cell wall protein gp1 [Streptomyces sp. SPB074]